MPSLVEIVSGWVLEPGVWGPLGFFLGALLEVFVPLPSPLLLIGAAFFFGKPLTGMLVWKIVSGVILPITLGATVGSTIVYAVAYKGGKAVIIKYEKWLGFSWDRVERIRTKLQSRKTDELLLLLSRSLPFAPTTVVTIAAGIIRVNVWVYILITFVGVFIRVSLLFIGAIFLGQSLLG